MALRQAWGENGDPLAGTVRLAGSPQPRELVRVELRDSYGRVLVQQERGAGAGGVPFRFTVEPWMPMLLEVRARLLDGEGEVSSAYAYFNTTRRNRGQFNSVVWDWPTDTLAPYAERQLARLGCTVQLGWGGQPPQTMAANNIATIPYTTRIGVSYDAQGYMQPTCWNDEPRVDEWIDSLVAP